MYHSLAEQASESDWSEQEKRAWYRERPDDTEYYPARAPARRIDTQGQAHATAAPRRGRAYALHHRHRRGVPLKRRALHVSLAFDDELSEEQRRALEEEWGEERDVTFQFHKFTSGGSGLSRGQLGERPARSGEQLLWPRPLHISF